jgi:hypothetical protein
MPEPLEIVSRLFPETVRSGETDMVEVLDDDAFWEVAGELIAPEAVIRFLAPEAGLGPGMMRGPFTGAEGFRAGWREWVSAFDSFRIEMSAIHTVSGGRVVLLVTTLARPPGSSAEIPQPSAAVYTVRDERIVAVDHYLEHEQALRDTGIA